MLLKAKDASLVQSDCCGQTLKQQWSWKVLHCLSLWPNRKKEAPPHLLVATVDLRQGAACRRGSFSSPALFESKTKRKVREDKQLETTFGRRGNESSCRLRTEHQFTSEETGDSLRSARRVQGREKSCKVSARPTLQPTASPQKSWGGDRKRVLLLWKVQIREISQYRSEKWC